MLSEDTARIAFAGMTYGKSDLPFTKHLEDVVAVCKRYLYGYFVSPEDRDAIVDACWLHDLVEDTDYDIAFVRANFGPLVAEIVEDVTDKPGKNRRERHRNTYPLFARKPKSKFVKGCDRIANTTSASVDNPSLMEMYRREYPYFRETLYVAGEFEEMWEELDRLHGVV